jgi:hypothetical protein
LGEAEGEEVASGDTGGLPLAAAAIARSLGEFLRFGGIGVVGFGDSAVRSGGGVIFSSPLRASFPPFSTKGAILAVTSEVEISDFGGAVLDSGVGAGAGTGVGEGSLAGAERLQVRVVVSLLGLSRAGSKVAVAVSELVATEERVSSARAAA